MIRAIEAIRTDNASGWDRALAEAGPHDFYHTAAYHALAERAGEGEAVLLTWQAPEGTVALPLLLRPIDRLPALAGVVGGLYDATSVYGYSGPVGRLPSENGQAAFVAALSKWLMDQSVICLFSRLHPLLQNDGPIVGAGEVIARGPTVAIDLSLSETEIMAQYRSNHRRDLRKLRKRGFACSVETGSAALSIFQDIYRETMNRVDAASHYYFDDAYLASLLDIDGLDLVICRSDGAACAAAIVSRFGPIAQYHLGGTRAQWLSDAPMKLIFDESRRMAAASGCQWLHLGGGLGAGEDALFNFKAGFSKDRRTFKVWRWVIDTAIYRDLAERAGARTDAAFFPAYADPTLSMA